MNAALMNTSTSTQIKVIGPEHIRIEAETVIVISDCLVLSDETPPAMREPEASRPRRWEMTGARIWTSNK